MAVRLEDRVLPFDFAAELFIVVLRFNESPSYLIVFDVALLICLEIRLLIDFFERYDLLSSES